MRIADLTVGDILDIRKKKSWNNPMNRLGELSQRVSRSPYDPKFQEELRNEVQAECDKVLGEYRVTKWTLAKGVAVASALAGIALIPFGIVPGVAATAAGIGEPILEYFFKKRKQQSLPFFLNELRR